MSPVNASKISQTIFGFCLLGLEVFLHYLKVELPWYFHISLLFCSGFFISKSLMVDFLSQMSKTATELLPWKKNGS